jgi:predicted small integral membrane protein
MDTAFPGNALLYRRITWPALWTIRYTLIIAGEALTGVALGLAAVSLGRHLRAGCARFARAKRFVTVGAGLGFLVWFFGFMVVGGEWFQMWQSARWNGQEPAYRFYMTILAVLIFVSCRIAIRRTAPESPRPAIGKTGKPMSSRRNPVRRDLAGGGPLRHGGRRRQRQRRP